MNVRVTMARAGARLSARLRGGSLRARLPLLIGVTLVAVCAATAATTAFAQRAYLIGDLDTRVIQAAERGQGEAHAAGTLGARLDGDGGITAAEVVTPGGERRTLTAAQRAALHGLAADGSLHTRTVPGLGTYRITVLGADGRSVLTGLPMGGVQHMISGLLMVEAAVAAVGLALAGCACAAVIRRQLRPLGRVAATAVEVSRSPLGRGEATGLTRVPERDTDLGSEAGQVGAALNLMIDHMERSLAERRRSEERTRRFLADASHELRTPLASIAGYAELMNRGGDRIDSSLVWRRISAESARMTGLVEDLLLLARLDEGRTLEAAEVDLAVLSAEAVWDARAAGDGHDWRLAVPLDVPALVIGDPARLRRVVAGLLANARVHTPPGTTVLTTVEATAERVVVRVRDDGPGIPAQLLPSVFERFTRADGSRSRTAGKQGGSGLGLAVAAAVTAAHGGRIGVESVPGRTEFTVELPPAGRAAPPPGTPRALPRQPSVAGR